LWGESFANPNRSSAIKILVKITIVVLAVLVLENVLAWTYMAKRIRVNEPVVGLIEQYAVLRPFRSQFPDQYKFPTEISQNFVGEISMPGVRRTFWIPDPIFGYRLAPNVVSMENVNTWFATNPQGFTITDADDPMRVYPSGEHPGVFRIIILGNSLVQGEGATGSLSALPAQLLRVLSQNFEPVAEDKTQFEVINAGVNGYHSAMELLFYLNELHLLQPDLVISYSGGSDLRVNNRLAEKFGPDFPRLETPLSQRNQLILKGYYDWTDVAVLFAKRSYSAVMDLLYRSATIDISIRVARKVTASLGGASADLFGGGAAEAPAVVPYSPDSVAIYAKNMGRFAREVEADGGTFAWFLQPLFGAGNKPPAEGRERRYSETRVPVIERRQAFFTLARREQNQFVAENPTGTACVADLTGVFDDNPNPVYQDFSHLFDVGNEIVAARIAEILVDCGLIHGSGGP